MRKLYSFAFILALYEFTTYASNDMIMPGMVSIVTQFNASLSYVPLSLSLYMLGECTVQLFLGSIAEKIGNRQTILLGNFLFLIFTVIIASSTHIWQFMLGRFLQGSGMAFTAIGYALIHETFDDKNAVKITSIMLNITILATLFGPIVGVCIISLFSWQYIFFLSAILGMVTLCGFYSTIPEGKTTTYTLTLKNIYINHIKILKSPNFILGILCNTFNTIPLMLWIGLAPNIILHNLNLGYHNFIIYQIITVFGLLTSSVLIQLFVNQFQLRNLIKIGAQISILGIILCALFYRNMLIVSICMSIYTLGFGISNGAIIRLVMRNSLGSQNNTASLINLCRTTMYVLIIQISDVICAEFNYSILSFVICCLVCTSIFSILINLFYHKVHIL